QFTPDDADETGVDDATLRALSATTALTYSCVPPGSGVRMALDRDEDGVRNRDDAEPATRAFIAIPNPSLPPLPEEPGDGGLEPVGGDAKTGDGRVCGCGTPPLALDSLWLALLVLGLAALRTRRRLTR